MVDVVLFVIDVCVGVILFDVYFVDVVCKIICLVIFLVNKVEGCVGEGGLYEFYFFGFGELIVILVEYGEGFVDFYDVLKFYVDCVDEEEDVCCEEVIMNVDVDEDGEIVDDEDLVGISEWLLCVVIVGCFNVGKFMLINWMFGEDCMLIGLEVGIICDFIFVDWIWCECYIKLFDMVGI